MNTPQPLHYSDELTVTPITIPRTPATPYESVTPRFQTPASRHDASFASSAASFDFGSPVDLSSASPATTPASLSASFAKDDAASAAVTPSADKVSENDSIRDLIMSAIGVMKSRKARPDTKRFLIL
jgi:hypothetical protein